MAKRAHLETLISGLDLSEIRFFSARARRNGGKEPNKYYLLFRHLVAGGSLDDQPMLDRLGLDSRVKITNLQRHLYAQILESLRAQHRRRDQTVQVREKIDYANLLYDRGLHLQAINLLGQARKIAETYHLDTHRLVILNFEKIIESRHITRSHENRMRVLTQESQRQQEVLSGTIKYSNLQINLQREFIENGHVRTAADRRDFYRRHFATLEADPNHEPGDQELALNYQCHFWFHYHQLNLVEAGNYAKKWTDHIDSRIETRERDLNAWIKGMDRRLLVAFLLDQPEENRKLRRLLSARIEGLADNATQHNNSRLMASTILLRAHLNQYLLDGDYYTALANHRRLAERIAAATHVDRHKQLVLYYKLAALCALADRPGVAVDYLQTINNEGKPLRYDVIVYGRLLFLCCHLRLGAHHLVDYRINNLARYLGRIGYESRYPRAVLQLLRNYIRAGRESALQTFRHDVSPLRKSTFHLRELRYLPAERFV